MHKNLFYHISSHLIFKYFAKSFENIGFEASKILYRKSKVCKLEKLSQTMWADE